MAEHVCDDCGKPAEFRYWEDGPRDRTHVGTFCREHAARFEEDNAKQVARVLAMQAKELRRQ